MKCKKRHRKMKGKYQEQEEEDAGTPKKKENTKKNIERTTNIIKDNQAFYLCQKIRKIAGVVICYSAAFIIYFSLLYKNYDMYINIK